MAEEEVEQMGIERRLERAICSRVQHFKDQADSLTLESVRRLLEKDLGLEKFALDAHKRFIRQYLEKKMEGTDDYNPKTKTEDVDNDVHLSKEEATISPKPNETKNNLKKLSTEDEDTMEDSPIMGVLTPKSEGGGQGSSVSESKIKKAIWERADHFLANSEDITLAGVRRLLEEDLGLDKNTLDPFKKLINQEIDQVLNSPKGAKSAINVKRKTSENLNSKKLKKISREESDSFGSESDEMEDKVKSRKEAASGRNIKKLEQRKKQKISKESELDVSSTKNKLVKSQKGVDNDSDVDGSLSEDGQSQLSVEIPSQRKEKSAPGYGKQVENLKSIIKASGMSVAPSVYKKAKQIPENKREAFLVKELEGILSREGLSGNPSEKEIKNCRKRKETARELEGIDMSNIISSSRRRSTFSFVAPVRPEIHAKKDKVGAKESKRKESDDRGHNNDKEEEEKEDKEDEKKEEGTLQKEGEGDDEREAEEQVEEDDDDEEEEEDEDEESEEFNEVDNEDSD